MSEQAIRQVLDNYTSSVTNGDRALFESQLLDTAIPFFGVRGQLPDDFAPCLESVQNYAGFRQGVFDSGTKFKQKFFDVAIRSDGDLAQVSLNFKTLRVEANQGGAGWKILHLLRVGGDWKIASEFYTVHALAGSDW